MYAPQHSRSYRMRRALNWFPLGLAYALFYMGRYNLNAIQAALGETAMPKSDFGTIGAIGSWVYGLSFLLTGPLTDKIGGRRTMLIGTVGVIVANVMMGVVLYGISHWGWTVSIFWSFAVLYGINMHFQGYGATAIVTVKAPWFHVRERGTFSTIFGVMITFGLYFAFDWGTAIIDATRAAAAPDKMGFWAKTFATLFGLGGAGVDQNWWLCFIPAIFLSLCAVAMFLWLRDTPGEAGYNDFDTGEDSLVAQGERLPVFEIFRRILTHPVLIVVCAIEFCSGILRNGMIQWYPKFAEGVGFKKEFLISSNWGLTLMIAGLGGAIVTGWASDVFFKSKRAPMATILYGAMIASTIVLALTLGHNWWFGGVAAFTIALAVIGVHSILSGTSTADFGGAKNAGAAVGIVDGMVYLGNGIQSFVIGKLVPKGDLAKDPDNWVWWPIFLVPFSVVGLILSARIWHALPKKSKAASDSGVPKPVGEPADQRA